MGGGTKERKSTEKKKKDVGELSKRTRRKLICGHSKLLNVPKTHKDAGQTMRIVPINQKTAQGKATDEVRRWIKRALDMGVANLRQEYRDMAKYKAEGMSCEAFKMHHEAGKNRYQDVPCQDQGRVILNWPGCPIDYIHANYVATPNREHHFICTQGPLDSTIPEFWTMIAQEKTNVIIMLCNIIECGKYKCAQYWPENEGDVTKIERMGFTIINTESMLMNRHPSVKRTKLVFKYKNKNGKDETRDITHLHWLDWPDRGVPTSYATAIELLSNARGSQNPILVHCSAGIGRTGSIVAIEYIMQRLNAGKECASMNELLRSLRDQRAWSIQNDLQYLYVHRVMLYYLFERHAPKYAVILEEAGMQEKYKKFLLEYDIATQ